MKLKKQVLIIGIISLVLGGVLINMARQSANRDSKMALSTPRLSARFAD